jgi:amino acid adenylation domain-containing protein
MYVLDSYGEPAPVGVAGELYIGGAGVARGYLNRPELTTERFLPDPFGKAPFIANPGARMYRTGDLGRWLPDGTIEYLGRNDSQVKLRGFRIEPGEIEARLLEHESVREAVVVVREDEPGDKRLVAYYTAEERAGGAEAPRAEQLRAHLAARLPEHMLPAAYVKLESLPLTPNGKLDRKALPAPEGEAYSRRGYEAPQGETETLLAATWAEALRLERVGRHDNFFELGGHSLLAVTLVERMRQAGLQVDVRALFTRPTLAELASAVGAQVDAIEAPPNLIPPGCKAITPEMLPLLKLSEEEIDRLVSGTPGGAANIQDVYPLAPLQEGILFHHLMGGEGDPYVLGSLMSFESRELLDAYLRAMQAVIDRHDILRTAVIWEGLPEPVQVVWRTAPLPVEEVELEEGGGDAEGRLYERFSPRRYRMDVREAPLMRVYVTSDPDNRRWLLMQLTHHLTVDHSTLDVLRKEIEAHLLGEEGDLPAPLPFRNLVAQSRLGVSREEHEAYFRRLLGDVEEPTAPFGFLNVRGDGLGIEEAGLQVGADLARRVRERARKLAVSAACLFHVAWALTLARVSGRQDVTFGTLLLGRMQGGRGADQVMGLFINTLPVRMRVGHDTAEESVRRAHTQLAELLRHEHASLALAQRCSAVPAPTPLFSSLLNYRHGAVAGKARPEGKGRAWEGFRFLRGEERTNYPCALSVDDFGEEFGLTAQVESPIEPMRICEHMQSALSSLIEALESEPGRPMRALESLPEREKRQVLYEWNATDLEYPGEKLVHELFEEQARIRPDAVAVVSEGDSLSYGELNRRANRLAHYLRELGVGPDARVAICLERGVEMIVALLATLKAGGAYAPLDPAYPEERLRFMLADCAPVALLTQGRLPVGFEGLSAGMPVLDLADEYRWGDRPETDPDRASVGLTAEGLAYVIYTSGSTGTPKGVMVGHRGIVRLVLNTDYVRLTAEDVIAQASNASFDAATFEIWGALLNGARLERVRREDLLSSAALAEKIERTGVSVLFLTTGLFNQLAREKPDLFQGLRYLLFGGEQVEPRWVRQVAEGGKPRNFLHVYGPTETVTYASWYEINGVTEDKGVPIGRPIGNTRMYVLDSYGEPAPVGVAGELYIGGAGVARGYLNRPELTAERFLPDPFAKESGTRIYKTGDLGRWLSEGTVEYVGRNDFQVKVRGFRIELGEIESRLLDHESVREAVVVVREDEPGDKRLVAYYTTGYTTGEGAEGEVGAEALRAHLAVRLPEHMVPAAYVRLESLPLTPNGKLDRKALPAPEGDAYSRQDYEAPRGETEALLAATWAEALRLERVGRHDDFFELGGHSLLAVQVIARLRHSLGVEVGLNQLFAHPSVAGLAQSLEGAVRTGLPAIRPTDRPEKVPLSFAQKRLWFLAQIPGVSQAYHIPIGLRLRGELNVLALRLSLDSILERHEALRTSFESRRSGSRRRRRAGSSFGNTTCEGGARRRPNSGDWWRRRPGSRSTWRKARRSEAV